MSPLGQRPSGHQHRILDVLMVRRTPEIARFDRAIVARCWSHRIARVQSISALPPKADMAQHEFVMAFVDSNISVVNSRMERASPSQFRKILREAETRLIRIEGIDLTKVKRDKYEPAEG